jgi:hypothetical protein
MKNLFYLLPLTMLACSSPLEFSRATFSTNPDFTTDPHSSEGYEYAFENGSYSIDYVDEKSIPRTMYRIEEGKYEPSDEAILLAPSKKLYCSLFGLGDYFNCMQLTPISDARYISPDTLPLALQTKLGFTPRSVPVLRSQHSIIIVDDAVSGSPLVLENMP